jgi:hypothetical protein
MNKSRTKKSTSKKTISREDKITQILAKVSEICDYAIDNQCTQQAQFEELEMMLWEYID